MKVRRKEEGRKLRKEVKEERLRKEGRKRKEVR